MRALDWLVSPKNLFLSLSRSLARSLSHADLDDGVALVEVLLQPLDLLGLAHRRRGRGRRQSDNCAPSPGSAPQGRKVQRTSPRVEGELVWRPALVRCNCTLRARARARDWTTVR